MCKIFIVDDDNFFGGMLQYHLQLNPAYKVPLPTNTKDCISNAYLYPDLICADLGLPDIQADELFKQIKAIKKR